MDPTFVQTVLLGVFTNALTSLFGYLGGKLNYFSFDEEDSVASLIKETDFEFTFEELADMDELPSNMDMESVCKFLESPEIESIVRQIYASQFSDKIFDDENLVSIREIKDEFSLLFSQYFNINKEKNSRLISQIFAILIMGCEKTLGKLIGEGDLSAHEAKSIYRSKITFDLLQTVNKNIAFLMGQSKINIQKIHKFSDKYREIIGKRYELIRSPSYNSNLRLPIDDIYVCPNFRIEKSVKLVVGAEQQKIFDITVEIVDLDEVLSNTFRVVILGDPGAGKTTFVQKISHELATRYSERIFSGTCVTPIIVVLREFQAKNVEKGTSIIDFITQEANSNYQVPVPTGAFEYLFLNGHILLIFDGLDELLDTGYREKVVDEIESFCTLYPSVPVIVTSRKVGYEQAPLRDDMFNKIELAPFNNNQVIEYVNKWFALYDDLTLNEKQKKAESFIKESQIVSDIRSNSLMLSLMCSIYREENYIPENRPKVYQKCSELLFEKWDRHRGISPDIIIPNTKIKPLLEHLAYSIFTDESFQEGITEKKLIKIAVSYLIDTVYEDIDEAERAAKDFIEFCKGRAWVFTDIGMTKEGESIYQFTHRTFLEYFTADWIVRKYSIKKISELLLPKISKSEWDVVSQLAFQIEYDYSENGDELFSQLLNKSSLSEDNIKYNLLFFASRCLQFIVPSPKITREITNACFNFSLHSGMELIKRYDSHKKELKHEEYELSDIACQHSIQVDLGHEPMNLILNLRNVMVDNINVVANTIEELITNTINEGDKCESLLSLEVCLNLSHDWLFPTKNTEFWTNLADRILENCYNKCESLIQKNFNLCIGMYKLNKISFDKLVTLHGLESIFRDYSYVMLPNLMYSGIAHNTFRQWLYRDEVDNEKLEEIGQQFLSHPYPCFKIKSKVNNTQFRNLIRAELNALGKKFYNDKLSEMYPNISHDSLFGIFCLLACLFELDLKNICTLEKKEIEFFVKPLEIIFVTWLGTGNILDAERKICEMGFTNQQVLMIKKWMVKEIHFIE